MYHNKLEQHTSSTSRRAEDDLGRSEYGGVGDDIEVSTINDGYSIVARGRTGLLPDDRQKIDSALDLSIDILDTAIKAIELGSSSRVLGILSQYLAGRSEGEVMNFAPAVLRRMKMIKVEMGKYRMGQSRQHQIAKVLPLPSKGDSKVAAFVFPETDLKFRRLFLTSAGISLSTTGLAATLIHELSHHFLNTKDYWFNSYAAHALSHPNASTSRIIKRVARDERGLLDLTHMAKDQFWKDSWAKARAAEISKKMSIKPSYANKIRINNADSIVSMILSLSRREIKKRNGNLDLSRLASTPLSDSHLISEWL
ncbi:hypothetical protein ACVWZP_001060 [Pseudomonas sp. TE36184]